MKHFQIYRNIPFIDSKGFSIRNLFFFQRANKRVWLELPFIGFTWVRIFILISIMSITGCTKKTEPPKGHQVHASQCEVCLPLHVIDSIDHDANTDL